MPDLNYNFTVFVGVDIPKEVLDVAAQNTRNKQSNHPNNNRSNERLELPCEISYQD